MQNKGAISFFAILLTLVCLYELSFTWMSSRIEKDAMEYAGGDSLKAKNYLDSIAGEVVYLGKTYSEVKEKEINLGLDLKGGMNVMLEVSVADVLRTLSNNSQDPTFTKALQQASAEQKKNGGDYVTLFYNAVKQIDPNAKLSSPAFFGNKDMQSRVNSKMTNDEVINVVREQVKSSIDNAYLVIRNRIDKFGVTQPNIQRLEGSDRILVELPGVKDPERVRKLLQGAAKLEFWETYENGQEIWNSLEAVNKRIAELNGLKPAVSDSAAATDTTQAASADSASKAVAQAADSAKSLAEKLASTKDSGAKGADSAAALKADQEKFRKENPLLAVLTQKVYQEKADGPYLYSPGPAIGLSLIKDTGRVNQYLRMPEVEGLLPGDVRFMWGVKSSKDKTQVLELFAVKVPRDGRPKLTGDHVVDARLAYGQLNNRPEVSMAMDGEGARIWKKMTGENVKRSIAITLDEYVYSAPTVQQEIAGGVSQITGDFSIKEAEDLANILNSGKMDAPARIVQEAVVGPSLGAEAIQAGLISSLVGLLLVFLFMAFYYSGGGIVADIALITNLFFLMGVMASLGAVLTLPGIAGIVLTIGMSVDANVLIYERIREELAAGKGYKLAIADGYKNAYSAIIDSNVTTLLTGVVLYVFGSGPIQGFATTLVIGICTSLFAAIFITRLIFDFFSGRNKQLSFSIPLTANILKDSNFDFINQRRRFYIISLAVIVLGLGSMFVRGFGYGVDFEGGRSYVLQFDKPVSSESARQAIYKAIKQAPDVKIYGGKNQLQVTTDYMIGDESLAADSAVSKIVVGELTKLTGKEPVIILANKVEPTVANDIKDSAILSVIFSLLILFAYLLIRFRKWQYGVGAIAALAYVVIFILSVFSIFNGILPFSLDIDQAFIAAILTVVGYSINDTVVIFDRIREYLGQHGSKSEDMATIINNALNSTLSRTVVTGLTTIGVLIILFFFGGEVIRGFSFAMLIGVIVGTYTSLFVASPVVVDLFRRSAKNEKKAE
jgi:SecD/SecF fusion protein